MKLSEAEVKLRRAWTSELYNEHEAVCWQYKVNLSKPFIEITNSKKEWGSWNTRTRILRMSGVLILEHSWDVTLNVFKHEMAHQIVSDLFGWSDGHGPYFDRACDMIGVPPEFRDAKGDLPRKIGDFREETIDSENMRMLEKVRKLLSLSRSANENEAFLAMKKANELIEKYNIDRIEQDRAAQFVYAIINHKKKRIENYQRGICRILQDHFFVDVVYSYLFDPKACDTYRTIELLGTVENVRIAEYVYYFLMNHMEILWKAHLKKNPDRAARNKRSYRLGIVEGFQSKLDSQAKQRMEARAGKWMERRAFGNSRPETMSVLIRAEDAGLKSFVTMRFPRLSSYKSAQATIDRETYNAGMHDGKALNLHKGIERKDGNRGRLLNSPLRSG